MKVCVNDLSMDIYKILPGGVPVECKHRAWIMPNAHCLYSIKSLITVTDDGTSYAPLCLKDICPLLEKAKK